MIRLLSILIVAFLAYNVANAQAPQNLTGPAAKNLKPWKTQTKMATSVVRTAEPLQKGPVNKNKKIIRSTKGKIKVLSNQGEKDRMKGPKAKNKKTWEVD